MRIGTVCFCLWATAALVCPPAESAAPEADTLFRDVTAEVGIHFNHVGVVDVLKMGIGTGAAWLDYDRDGDLDLYVTQGHGANRLYRNDDGRFVDVAVRMDAADSTHFGAGVAVADFNNDGWPDLYLANSDRDVLLKNVDGVRFEDISESAGIAQHTSERGVSASWGDFDNDGYVDLYVANHMSLQGLSYSSRDRLFRNNGDETFADVSHLLGSDFLSGFGFLGGWTDFDDDGDVDLLLINDCFGGPSRAKPIMLFRNDGGSDMDDWTFTEVSEEAGVAACPNGMGLASGDFNADGRIDHFYTNIGRRTVLLRNDGGSFTDAAEGAGVFVGYNPRDPEGPFEGTYSWGANFFDYDLDGRLDLYVTAGILRADQSEPMPNVLFRNRGDETFEDVSSVSGTDLPGRSRTSIVGDYDGDGGPDLFVADFGESVSLLRNESDNAHHHLVVRLDGRKSNRDGIGARIRVTTPDGRVQTHEVRSGSSHGGGDDLSAHFGLGTNTRASSIEVRWPSGIVQTLNDVPADQRLLITESTSTSTEVERPAVPPQLTIYPSPAREHVVIRVRTTEEAPVTVQIYDLLGRNVRTSRRGTSGAYELVWNGVDDAGRRLQPGVYFVRASVGRHVLTRSVVWLPE